MRLAWVRISAFPDSMGQRLLSLQTHLSHMHYRIFFTTVILDNLCRTSVLHCLVTQTGTATNPRL